jgi:hypothetical protein
VHVRGRVTVHKDLDELLRFATAIGARYMGENRGEEFGRRNAVPGELLVRVNLRTRDRRVRRRRRLTDPHHPAKSARLCFARKRGRLSWLPDARPDAKAESA